MRSSDGGLHWEKQVPSLFLDNSENQGNATPTDVGVAGQGPLLVAGGNMFALYFTEFATSLPQAQTAAAGGSARGYHGIERQIFPRRSVLHLAEVTFDGGWLHCNRSSLHGLQLIKQAWTTSPAASSARPPRLLLPPPVDANASAARGAPPLHIAADEAVVVALAELNRWHGESLGCRTRSRLALYQYARKPHSHRASGSCSDPRVCAQVDGSCTRCPRQGRACARCIATFG